MTDQQMGLQARLMSKALRKITGTYVRMYVRMYVPCTCSASSAIRILPSPSRFPRSAVFLKLIRLNSFMNSARDELLLRTFVCISFLECHLSLFFPTSFLLVPSLSLLLPLPFSLSFHPPLIPSYSPTKLIHLLLHSTFPFFIPSSTLPPIFV